MFLKYEKNIYVYIEKNHAPMKNCSLQHQTLLSPPDTSTTEHHFCFGPTSSFFLELLVNCSQIFPSSILDPNMKSMRGSSSSVIHFCLFILFRGFSREEYWSGLPFPPPVHHILSELFTMTCSSRVALQGMTHSFTE